MPRFRVKDLMINIVGEGDQGFPCELISVCGDVTYLCVEDTQGCAFTEACDCSVQTCGLTCDMTVQCTPCTQLTCGCTCSNCTACSARTCGACSAASCTVRSVGCTPRTFGCGASLRCTPTFDPARPLGPDALAVLKNELRAALARVEAEEVRLAEQMQPQTLDDVARLESKLSEALEDLQRRREELERRHENE
jgi:hypothetical protein